ncbi:hypothetical protein BV22DRAFT_1002256 [Leucogyrophana mollusca]|uniref:Uncharacterized protein n=1 Tax=Leucogyrophana mollusca TaxID=85980 RepID=A0ACB8BW93_9AGAM|nr:hypothetical protein BV22DRAFT_1002256 [Leucogyrophana mollusca]
MRKIDAFLNQESNSPFDAMRRQELDSTGALIYRSLPPPAFAPLPGPWAFLTSGYIVGLIVMAILLHRIQNIAVPPRHPFSRFTRIPRRRPFIYMMYHSVFPINFSSSLSRFVLRLPSLYFVCKALFVWTVTLAQTSDRFPPWEFPWLQAVGQWAAQKEMQDLCWSTFCAVCGALCVEALTRGLEGGNNNASPFNLFGYAFLLHIYSSPMTHEHKLEDSKSRPDKHVVLTIILPLLQLTLIHLMGIKQRWSNHRFIPSALVGILGLLHFHAVLWFSDSSYPLLNYMPCLFESILVGITLLAIFLNILTQVVTEGSVTRPLFGHQATLLPKWDEDFSVAVLRMGTASLEASSVAGLGNEVGVVAAFSPPALASHVEFGTVEMNRFGVTSISPMVEANGKQRKTKRGFANEIKSVKAITSEGDLWIDMAWYKELARFGVGAVRCLRSWLRLSWDIVCGRRRSYQRPRVQEKNEVVEVEVAEDEKEDEDVYERFIRGEQVSDDEDDDFEPSRRSRRGSISTPSTTSENPEEDYFPEDQNETVGLYADLSSAVSTSTSASLLLAHMADSSSSPLTRRRFQRLVSDTAAQSLDNEDWTDIMTNRRPPPPLSERSGLDDGVGEARRNCVICTVEPRQIICWPCRCLALCDDCRENLASRAPASKHACPCCRRNVEGYSKIFIP